MSQRFFFISSSTKDAATNGDNRTPQHCLEKYLLNKTQSRLLVQWGP